jgi:hypothetical protein
MWRCSCAGARSTHIAQLTGWTRNDSYHQGLWPCASCAIFLAGRRGIKSVHAVTVQFHSGFHIPTMRLEHSCNAGCAWACRCLFGCKTMLQLQEQPLLYIYTQACAKGWVYVPSVGRCRLHHLICDMLFLRPFQKMQELHCPLCCTIDPVMHALYMLVCYLSAI